ncbi:dTMP kinase [Alteromonas sediminis]|uniref:Thymidylate kinase n=1 Tax=Alteromonas sediminis TaxID=2259342 RepID=A0A3N5Y0R7_9ALTE|nr:dTMP kinase [Alteromonas sediminis]RPJ67307.1 dTMP kinase [Alteromonas sediminis]
MIKPIGKFIVVEGLEGAGKSSAINAITHVLQTNDIDHITTREPGGTPMAERIRECVKHDWEERVDEKTELLLMYAARVQLVENTIKPALERGVWVIGDRHDLSSQAYQGGGRGLDKTVLGQLKSLTLGDFEPDLTLYLDIDPEVGLRRAKGRGALDRIEKASLDFFIRTRERYLELVNHNEKAEVIDAMQDMPLVHQRLKDIMRSYVSS